MQDSDALRRGIAEVYLRNTNAPHLRSSSPGLTGRPSIPETPGMESRSRGVLDTPLEPVVGLAEGETRWRAMRTNHGATPRVTATCALIEFLPALRHRIEKRPRLAVEKLHVRRASAAGGGVSGHGARADRHHLDVRDVLAGLLRL